jgi:hypothetical protein
MQGFSTALALHMGKILECAAIPGSGAECMSGTLDASGFVLEALNPDHRCTVTSVAALTLYEKSDPRARLARPMYMEPNSTHHC